MTDQIKYQCTLCGQEYDTDAGMDDLMDHIARKHVYDRDASYRMTCEEWRH